MSDLYLTEGFSSTSEILRNTSFKNNIFAKFIKFIFLKIMIFKIRKKLRDILY